MKIHLVNNLQFFAKSYTIRKNEDGTTTVVKENNSGSKTTSTSGNGYNNYNFKTGSFENSTGTKTSNTSNNRYDYNTDYSVLGNQAIQNGSSWQTVQDILDKRNAKIADNPELKQYDYFNSYLTDYITKGQKIDENEKKLEETYQKMLDMLNEANNMKFDYQYENDPLYKTYMDQYQKLGNRAMQNALAEATANTGGLASSWSMTAGQQANDYYNGLLAGKIPELYQLAYNNYANERNGLLDQVNSLGSLYDRQNNALNASYNDLYNYIDRYRENEQIKNNQAFNQEQFNYNKQIDQRNFDYQAEQDALDRKFKEEQAQLDRQLQLKQISVSQYNAQTNRLELEYKKEQSKIEKEEDNFGLFYQDMMLSGNPTEWLAENASSLTKSEIEALKKIIDNDSSTSSPFSLYAQNTKR